MRPLFSLLETACRYHKYYNFKVKDKYIRYGQHAVVTLLWVVAVTDNTETFDKHIQEASILVWA